MDLTKMDKVLENAIKNGTFVPFFGAASPSIRRNNIDSSKNEIIWGKVYDRIQNIQKTILKKHGEFYYDKTYKFLSNLAISHDIKLNKKVDYIKDQENDPLLNFQVSIIELLNWCSDKVAERINNNAILPEKINEPVIDFNDLADKEKDTIYFASLMKSIFESINILKKATHNDKIENLLPLNEIEKNLRMYVCKVFCEKPIGSNDKYQIDSFDDYVQCIGCMTGLEKPLKSLKKITLGELRWLKELLWWTSRYDVPIYPTSSELAHYMSYFLNVPLIGELRDYDLSLVAGAVNEGAKHLRKLFNEIERNRKGIGTLKDTETNEISHKIFNLIAKYLTNHKNTNIIKKIVPLAVTTNYDNMLEDELEREISKGKTRASSYRVVFPVWIDKKPSIDKEGIIESINWICKRVEINTEEKNIKYEFIKDKNDLISDEPTVIKIHGAPCIDIETVKSKIIKNESDSKKHSIIEQIKHFVILSESNYLNSLPIFMGSDEVNQIIFNSGKSIWFLGYSVSDWDVRVMMLQGMSEKVISNKPIVKGEIKDSFSTKIDDRVNNGDTSAGAKYYILKPGGFDNYHDKVFEALDDTISPINENLSTFYNYLIKAIK